MGFEDRDYFQSEYARKYEQKYRAGGMGFRFDKRSIVLILIVINTVIFLLDMFTPTVSVEAPELGNMLAYYLGFTTDRLWAVWGLLTYGFAHASIGTESGGWHLLFNMAGLFFLGTIVEMRIGKQEFLWFYLTSIVVSGLGWLLWVLIFDSGPTGIVGASGAVCAVVMYFVFMMPHEKVHLMAIIPVPAWAIGVAMLFFNLLYALDPQSPIAWQAHLAGAAFGAGAFHYGWRFAWMGEPLAGLQNLTRPNLKVHDPEADDEKLKRDADAVLEKINCSGEGSLTRKERKTLDRYSKQLRKSRES